MDSAGDLHVAGVGPLWAMERRPNRYGIMVEVSIRPS